MKKNVENPKIEKNIGLEYGIIVTDKKGKEVFRLEKQTAKSYVKQFLQALKVVMAYTTVSMKKTTGDLVDVAPKCTQGSYWANTTFKVNAGDEVDAFGIQVGSGDIAASNDDYKLADQILHGTESNQLSYGAVSFYDITEDSGYVKFAISRTFFNGSPAAIDVKEIGLVARVICEGHNVSTNYGDFLFIRDVLSSPVTVNVGNTLTVQYTLKTKV